MGLPNGGDPATATRFCMVCYVTVGSASLTHGCVLFTANAVLSYRLISDGVDFGMVEFDLRLPFFVSAFEAHFLHKP